MLIVMKPNTYRCLTTGQVLSSTLYIYALVKRVLFAALIADEETKDKEVKPLAQSHTQQQSQEMNCLCHPECKLLASQLARMHRTVEALRKS